MLLPLLMMAAGSGGGGDPESARGRGDVDRARESGSVPSKAVAELALAKIRFRLPERRVGVVGGDCGGELEAVTALRDDTFEGLRVETNVDAEGLLLVLLLLGEDVNELCDGRLMSKRAPSPVVLEEEVEEEESSATSREDDAAALPFCSDIALPFPLASFPYLLKW